MNLPPSVAHFARFLSAGNPQAEQAAALAALAAASGHVCADLDLETGWGPWAFMDAEARSSWRLRLSSLAIIGGADDWSPLVWDGRRLYLRRYYDYECRVAADLRARSRLTAPVNASVTGRLGEIFPDPGQRAAARIALTQRLALISGGPGTGKTYTLARIIDLLQQEQPDLRVALAAPTGKAAVRMSQALRTAGVAVTAGASTLHRLLGMRADGTSFLHHRDHTLAIDVLVVDEASMIDLSLMAHLLDALPEHARLILIGDRDQLAAVEAGAVFADLCKSASLAGCRALLTTNFRFDAASGIGQLAERLREGDWEAVLALLTTPPPNLHWLPNTDRRVLLEAVREGYGPYQRAVSEGQAPEALFKQFDRFRVLCAHRQDVFLINRELSEGSGCVGMHQMAGTPIMALRNDLALQVFNGDIGLIMTDPTDHHLKACFPGETLRWVPLSRLPEWEPAWAMTVHKSQGSEFDRVLLVLPESASPVATRELVYTGITRAKETIALRSDAKVLIATITQYTERMSGLLERLRQ